MNILLVARWPVGGIKTYFRYIYGSAEFEKVNITLFAPAEGLDDYLATQLPPGRITLVPAPVSNKDFILKLFSLVKNSKFDVVHSHGFSASMLAQVALTFFNVPHIMTAHDVFLPNTFLGTKGKLKKLAMGWLLNRVDKVLSVSLDARANMLEYFPGLQPKQVLNITNGIDTLFFGQGVARNLREELSIAPGRPILGFFGRFMAQKGFHQIIKAVEIICKNPSSTIQPMVVTFGWGGYIREDFALIEQKGLSDYFRQLPGTNDMPAAIRGVDLVVMPSRWEACPLLPMEVLSTGTPIVGTACVGLREVLESTPAKVVAVDDTEALASAIVQQLMEGPEVFKHYQPIAVARFSADKHAEELRQFYNYLVDTHR